MQVFLVVQVRAQEYDLGDRHYNLVYNLVSEPRLKATPVLTRRVIIKRKRGRVFLKCSK